MTKQIENSIQELRALIKQEGLYGLIIPANDPHFSEYLAKYWKCLRFITNFTGSAGTAVITLNEAAIWVDSRYYIQAQEQCEHLGFEIQRVGLPATPTIAQWLEGVSPKASTIGADGKLYNLIQYKNTSLELQEAGLNFRSISDPFLGLWNDRPSRPNAGITILSEEVSGQSTVSKLEAVRTKLALGKEDYYLISALDEIAWLLNIRGRDVSCNPVVVSYLAVGGDSAKLFIDPEKLSQEDIAYLSACGVGAEAYDSFDGFLEKRGGQRVIYNPNKLDIYHYDILNRCGAECVAESDMAGVVTRLKAIKNEIELEGFRKAMLLDGVALVKFHYWLEQQMSSGATLNELQLSQKAAHFKAEADEYIMESFGQIVGSGASGALPHYSIPSNGGKSITKDSFLLMDMGSQYSCGTTDITRTIHFGIPNDQQKLDYTLVLQGMIDLTNTIFPVGTSGDNLDIIARRPLLGELRNYGHGTGHGVGHYLNVHEGPFGIRAKNSPEPIEAGSVMSNEPAIYRSGEYGIRIENMMFCKEIASNEFGSFLGFETLTLFPIETKSIIVELLTKQQRTWINDYHKEVFERLSPMLNEQEQEWLRNKTSNL